MQYEIRTEGSRVLSISINVVNGRINRNYFDPSRDYPMSAADVVEFKERALTQQTYNLFVGGWDCPEVDVTDEDYDGKVYTFEGEVLVDGAYQTLLHDITGCIYDEDERVMGLIDVMQEMRLRYYPDDSID
jgi:hypothetical protein